MHGCKFWHKRFCTAIAWLWKLAWRYFTCLGLTDSKGHYQSATNGSAVQQQNWGSPMFGSQNQIHMGVLSQHPNLAYYTNVNSVSGVFFAPFQTSQTI